MDSTKDLTIICDKIEEHEKTFGEPKNEFIEVDDISNTKECDEKNEVSLKEVEIDKNLLQNKLNVQVDHSNCNNETNENEVDIKIEEQKKIENFEKEDFHNINEHEHFHDVDEYEHFHDIDEHDDFDDFEEEEDLHAGENFWCSLCDDGGDLLFCDGPCLRTFHGCISAKKDHDCKTLGFTKEQYQIIVNAQTWICPNCETNQQLCFLCHQLGRSIGPNQKVFNCHSAHCGQFYHPMCIAKWMFNDKEKQKQYAESIQQNVETFLCPLHMCKSCKKLEDATDTEKKFAKCRRCPVGWHVDCLPKDIPFEEEAELRGIPQRAWKVELGDEKHHYRVGIYCSKHDFPIHPYDMVKFPYRPDFQLKCIEGSNSFSETSINKIEQSKTFNSNLCNKKIQHIEKEKQSHSKTKKTKVHESKKNLIDDAKVHDIVDEHKSIDFKQSSESKHTSRKKDLPKEKINDVIEAPLVSLIDIKKSVDDIILKSKSNKTIEGVKKNLCTPSFYTDKNGEREGKFIHEGELISILTSIPKALNWIKSGKRIDEAKALCPLRSIIQLERVEKALEAFLNPCLYGQRYTSFGRHFTKREILIEIVDRLQWYIRDKDMVVDFCCGANEFSVEVSRKLIEVGKKNCNFKNFDILAPKNEFNFEQRDWFTIQRHELPSSDKLIMGLNPPFGKRSALANAFIDRAITFRPKIIILIVPPSTKRLDGHGYELIWEDPRLLGGQAFYLPGSITKEIKDANGTTRFSVGEDWNKNTPPLYMWSRKDWVVDHLEIAQQHGHISDLNSKGEPQQFNLFYKSKVDWDKVNTLKLPQPSIVEKPTKVVNETHKNEENDQDIVKTRDDCSVEETLQTPIESISPILLEEPLKMPLKTLDDSIDDEMKSKSESRHQNLMKKPYTSSQRINVKENVKDGNGEKVEEVEKQSIARNGTRGGFRGNSNVNEYLEKPYRNETLETKESSKQITDEKRTKENGSMQHDSSREKKKTSANLNKEVKHTDEGFKHIVETKSEGNVYKQYATTRLKRARSPSMILDHGNASNFKAKRLNENINWNNRESRRPTSKDEKQTKKLAFDSPKDIIHRQRITRHDAEISHCNKFNMAREDIERDHVNKIHHGRQDIELKCTNRIYHGKQDFEQERLHKINHKRQDIEQERLNKILNKRQDIEQERLNKIHHGRQDIEQERLNKLHHRRQDIEQGRADRTHHRRQEIEHELANRTHHGRQETKQEHLNKMHHGRQDVDKRERLKQLDLDITKEMNENNISRYEDSKRNYSSQELSPESKISMYSRNLSPKSRRSSSLQDLEPGFRRFRSQQDFSPKSRHITTSQDMFDEQRLEDYDKYNFKDYDHGIRRSPEISREVGISKTQCIEDQSKSITYPKWFTAQTNTGGLGRSEDNRSKNLPIDLRTKVFEKDNLKFPILHGNYENHDIPMNSQIYNTNYSDLTKDNYMDHLHSPRLKMDYSNPQEMTFMQRNNYNILGVHNSPKNFNCFNGEKNYANQRFCINNLHSFDNLDGNIGRDYGINDFPRSSLIGSDIPSLSKNMHEDPWSHLSQKNGLLNSYRNDINHSSTTKIQDYTTSWNNITSSPPSHYRHSTFENPHISSLENSWNQPSLYALPSTNLLPFSQRENYGLNLNL